MLSGTRYDATLGELLGPAADQGYSRQGGPGVKWMEQTELLETARALATDAAAGEVFLALAGRGIDSILLKGPTIAEWLYPDELRPYVDADLLVAPDHLMMAAEVLRDLGFAPYERQVSPHAHPWIRSSDWVVVDLHVAIWGPQLAASGVWMELQGWVEEMTVGSVPIKVLSLPGRALHIVLHAAQHRDNMIRPRDDLRRVLRLAPPEVWRAAERLADRLWALGAMADGLLLDPAGASLLESLPLLRTAFMIDQEGVPPLALALARVADARGVRRKAAVAARGLVSPAHPRRAPAEAAAGPCGFRLRRAVALITQAPAAIVAMRRVGVRRRREP
jgi:hypothetical protein